MPTQIRYWTEKQYISKLIIKGHSNFAYKGKDIVCSAISAIVNGTANFLIKFYSTHFNIKFKEAEVSIKTLVYNKQSQECLKMMIFQ